MATLGWNDAVTGGRRHHVDADRRTLVGARQNTSKRRREKKPPPPQHDNAHEHNCAWRDAHHYAKNSITPSR